MAASSKANTALLLTLWGFCVPGLALVGLVVGIVALLEFKRDVNQEGKGKAIAAVVIGSLPLLFLAVMLLTKAITAYASNFILSRALLGAIAAVPAGALIGTVVTQLKQNYRRKAELGPLPLQVYWWSNDRLRMQFLGSMFPLVIQHGIAADDGNES